MLRLSLINGVLGRHLPGVYTAILSRWDVNNVRTCRLHFLSKRLLSTPEKEWCQQRLRWHLNHLSRLANETGQQYANNGVNDHGKTQHQHDVQTVFADICKVLDLPSTGEGEGQTLFGNGNQQAARKFLEGVQKGPLTSAHGVERSIRHTAASDSDGIFQPTLSISSSIKKDPVFQRVCRTEVTQIEYSNVDDQGKPLVASPCWSPTLPTTYEELEEAAESGKLGAYRSESTRLKELEVDREYSTQWTRLQEARLRQVLFLRKERWMKQQDIPDVDKIAGKLIDFNKKWNEHETLLKQKGLYIHVARSSELDHVLDRSKLQELEEEMEKRQLIANLKKQLRQKRVELRKVFRNQLDGLHTHHILQELSPFKQRQRIRAVRLAYLIKEYLEPLLSNGTAGYLYGALKGLHVSVSGVYRKTPTSTAHIYYNILSPHSAKFAQERLELVTPYLRYRLQMLVNFPRAPALQFHYAGLFDPISEKRARLSKVLALSTTSGQSLPQATSPLPHGTVDFVSSVGRIVKHSVRV